MPAEQPRTAIVTGGASGMGAAVSRKLASRGVNVLIADIQHQERGEELAKKLADAHGTKAIYVRTDVSKEEDVRKMVATVVEAWGRLDYGVNCAGICESIWAEEESISTELVDKTFGINQRGIWLCQKFEALQMAKQELRTIVFDPPSQHLILPQRGAIVNIASIACQTGMGLAAYTPTKSAVIGITRNGAKFYGPKGIRCNAVCPGYTLTPMLEISLGEAGKAGSKESEEHPAVHAIPLGRLSHAEEQANAINFLLSDESSYINGTYLLVDGGFSGTR